MSIGKKKEFHKVKRVYAVEDIHCQGEVIVRRGTPGNVVSSGSYALNVKFDGYKHIILCFWNMVSRHTELRQLEMF